MTAHLATLRSVGARTSAARLALGAATGSDVAHLVLAYRIGSTRPVDPTRTPIGEDQGVVLDGRLIAIQAIRRVGSRPRSEAQVIVFPASAATGLPVVT